MVVDGENKKENECCLNHVVMKMVNACTSFTFSFPALLDAALRKKLCLRCCNIGNSFWSAQHHLLNTVPLSWKQSQMPQISPEDWLPLSLRVIISVDVHCNCYYPTFTPPAMSIRFKGERRVIWEQGGQALTSISGLLESTGRLPTS